MKHCPYCPCTFETQADLDAHMRAFGDNKEEHLTRFHKARMDQSTESDY
jgi:hypothetical protein